MLRQEDEEFQVSLDSVARLSVKELSLRSQVSAMLVFADLENELGDEGAAQSAESSLASVHPGSILSTGRGSVCLHCSAGEVRAKEIRSSRSSSATQ